MNEVADKTAKRMSSFQSAIQLKRIFAIDLKNTY